MVNYILLGSNCVNVSQVEVYNALQMAQIHQRYVQNHDTALYNCGVYLDPNSAGFARFNADRNSDSMSNNMIASYIITDAISYLAQDKVSKK